MEPKEITASFVEGRWRALEKRWGGRNKRMDEYEKLYLLNNWEEEPEPDERRISAPIAFDTVERSRTLLLTRPPVISVPASEVKAVATDQADQMEKYLYGVWYQAHVLDALDLAEWHASCLAEGVLRCVCDRENAVEDELPLVVQALDPRTVYPNPSGRPGIDAEVVHAFKRSRREIESEWGVELERPETSEVEAWLDEEVDFVDYWRVDVEEVAEEQRSRGAEEQRREEEPAGVLARLVEMARRAMAAGGTAGEETLRRAQAEEQGSEGAEGEGPGARGEGAEEEGEGKARKVRRRVVTNCMVVEGQFVKEPVKMPGYKRLPFVRYAGITTPLANEDGALSVLFPITGGVRKKGAIGLVAVTNELLAMKQRIIEMYATGALITDDDKLEIDWKPGAVNYVRKGCMWNFLVPPGPHPAVDQQIALVERLIQDVTFSAAMMGRPMGSLSGMALSIINNPAMMKVAHRQQVRERAYQELNSIILSLTEEYAPPGGWSVWGTDKTGATVELALKPAETPAKTAARPTSGDLPAEW